MAIYSVLTLLAVLATTCTASSLEALAVGSNSPCYGRGNGPVSNQYDCGSYINCDSGYGTKQYCPKGQEFNPENGACDFPINVNPAVCQKAAPNAGDVLCPQERGVHFVASQDYCNAYFVCGNGLLQSSCVFCPYGQYFAVEGHRCQKLYDGECGSRAYVQPRDQTITILQPGCQPGKGDPFRALNEKIAREGVYGSQYGNGVSGQGSNVNSYDYGVSSGGSNGQGEYYGNQGVNQGGYH